MAVFQEVDPKVARALIATIDRRNLGKTFEVAGVSYTLDFISQHTSAFWRSRGLSVYFRTTTHVVRISDHWAKSEHYPQSRKLNCGSVSGKSWTITNSPNSKLYIHKYAGRFPFEVLAGSCSLAELRQDCDHWPETPSECRLPSEG